MNPQSGFSRLKAVGKRSFSDFVKLNQGRVGSKNALALGSIVGGSVLMELFLSSIAHATDCCYHSQWQVGSTCYNECTYVPPVCEPHVWDWRCGTNCDAPPIEYHPC